MKKLIKSKLLIQVVVASMVATLATAGIVAAATTIGANISTTGTLGVTGLSSLGQATSTMMTVSGVTYLDGGLAMNGTAFTVANTTGNTSITGTLGVTGVTTLINASSTLLTVSGMTYLDGGITVNTDKFTVIAGSGNTTVAGTLGAGATTITNLTASGNLAFATASSTGQVKVASLGIASTTPAAGFQLSIGTGASASSTISMGKFCMYAVQEDGVAVYLRLGSNQPANQPFATSTIPCN